MNGIHLRSHIRSFLRERGLDRLRFRVATMGGRFYNTLCVEYADPIRNPAHVSGVEALPEGFFEDLLLSMRAWLEENRDRLWVSRPFTRTGSQYLHYARINDVKLSPIVWD